MSKLQLLLTLFRSSKVYTELMSILVKGWGSEVCVVRWRGCCVFCENRSETWIRKGESHFLQKFTNIVQISQWYQHVLAVCRGQRWQYIYIYIYRIQSFPCAHLVVAACCNFNTGHHVLILYFYSCFAFYSSCTLCLKLYMEGTG